MRIVLHGFGSFPVVFWHLIQQARASGDTSEWAIILTSDHYEARFRQLLGDDRVTVLTQVGGVPGPGEENWNYPGFLFRDLASEKRNYKSGSSASQRERGMEMYRQTRRFMEAFRPTHALVSQVEGFDGKVFIAAAKEQGARVAVPTGLRNLGGIFFAPDDFESVPSYAFQNPEAFTGEATRFIQDFRTAPKPAVNVAAPQGALLDDFCPPLPTRAFHAMRRWLSVPGGFQPDFLRVSLLNNLPGARDLLWATRARWNQRHFDIGSVGDLPSKFIFYPLQYTPESSINTPAPYFVDQLRAIDAIRFSMPSDCTLVVKEHPTCIWLRSSRFIRQLQCTAGLAVAHFRIPSVELVKRAALTISVTGTATIESMLLGRPAICLGANFIAGFLGGVCPIDRLPERVRECFGRDYPTDDAVRAVATLMNARYPAAFSCPGTAGEPVLRKDNIACFWTAFLDHCRREAECEASDGQARKLEMKSLPQSR